MKPLLFGKTTGGKSPKYDRWNCSVEIFAQPSQCWVQVYDRNSNFIWGEKINFVVYPPLAPYAPKHIDLNSVAAGTEGCVIIFPDVMLNYEFPAQLVIRGSGSNQDTVVNFMRVPEMA